MYLLTYLLYFDAWICHMCATVFWKFWCDYVVYATNMYDYTDSLWVNCVLHKLKPKILTLQTSSFIVILIFHKCWDLVWLLFSSSTNPLSLSWFCRYLHLFLYWKVCAHLQLCFNVDMRDRREGIHTSVNHEVNSVFKGKTLSQLNILQDQIRNKLKGEILRR